MGITDIPGVIVTLTAQLRAVSPAVETIRHDLRAHLNRSDLTGYDLIPPMAIIDAISEAWPGARGDDEKRDFVSFVGSLVEGTGWAVDDEATAYASGPKLQTCIVLLRNN